MSDAEPLAIVAVNVTVASPEPYSGLVTVPSFATTLGVSDTQVIAVPFSPADGNDTVAADPSYVTSNAP